MGKFFKNGTGSGVFSYKTSEMLYYIGAPIELLGMLIFLKLKNIVVMFVLFFIASILMFPHLCVLYHIDDKRSFERSRIATIVMFYALNLFILGDFLYKFFITDGNIWRIIMLFDKS